MIDSIYKAFKNYIYWWQLKPADEREQGMFATAYQRAFMVLIIALFSTEAVVYMLEEGMVTVPTTLEPLFTISGFGWYLGAVGIAALLAGGTAFKDHELEMNDTWNHYWIWGSTLFAVLAYVVFAVLP